MILASPWTYGYKTILPIQAVFLQGGSFMLARRNSAPGADGLE